MEDAEPLWEVSSILVELGVWSQTLTPQDSCLTRVGNRESEVKVLVAQSRLPLCDSRDCSPPGSSVHGILQARTLECHGLLQGIFPTQAWNPLQADSLPSEPSGKPRES